MAGYPGNLFGSAGVRQLRTFAFVILATAIGLIFTTSATSAGELHDAVRAQDKVAVEALLASGSAIDEPDYLFGTALHIAVSGGDTETFSKIAFQNSPVLCR